MSGLTPSGIGSAVISPDGSMLHTLRNCLAQNRQSTEDLLAAMLRIESISGQEGPLVDFLSAWATQHGLATDRFELSEDQLRGYPQAAMPHIPLAGRPTLVIRFPGHGTGQSLMFNAHSDVISPGDPARWKYGPWSGRIVAGRIYGRGACDVKGPLASALAALLALRHAYPTGLPGDVLVEIIPGEEDCVGLGTLTSYMRGYHPDGLIVLEPTEGLPQPASRGGVRFTIRVRGQAVHGAVKWMGQDAIIALRMILEYLAQMETQFSALNRHALFADYPIQRPITVDRIQGANWQGAICDLATCQGYLELLPTDDLAAWKKRFHDRLMELHQHGSGRGCQVEIEFAEEYGGHEISPAHRLAQAARSAIQSAGLAVDMPPWAGFNAGCEAGLRWNLQQTPTLVWGPGSLLQAHGLDEFVPLQAVHEAALAFALCAIHWITLRVE
ncbi:MAG: M20 family metallopeptidase [Phycisphaerae bacterium]